MNQRFPKSVPQLILIQVGWIWTRHVAMLWSAWGSDLANMIKSPKCHHSTSHGGQMRVPAPVFCALGFRPAEKQAFECVYFPKKQRRTSYRDDGLLQGRSGNWDDQEFSQFALH